MPADSELSPLAIPSDLLAEVQALASEERRPPADVLQDAVRSYAKARRWQRVLTYGEDRAAALRLDEADVPRLIAESRAERRDH